MSLSCGENRDRKRTAGTAGTRVTYLLNFIPLSYSWGGKIEIEIGEYSEHFGLFDSGTGRGGKEMIHKKNRPESPAGYIVSEKAGKSMYRW